MLTLIAALTVFTVSIGSLLWHRRHHYRLSWQLPGPIALPIIGNGLSIVHPESKLIICWLMCTATYSLSSEFILLFLMLLRLAGLSR